MSEDVRRLVGGNVRRLRIAAGVTQAALADLVGVDRAYISGLEQGNRNATIVSLWHVAKALDAPIRSLFDEAKNSR
jgi:transcriptional regulator with XRE-family HTH domain